MNTESKLMEMLTGYAAAHQHPVNVGVHLIGIPIIMLGVMVPLTRVGYAFGSVELNLAHLTAIGFFLFYLTLDRLFAFVFLVFALLATMLAGYLGNMGSPTYWYIAGALFFGGYIAQFIGHAIEKSAPVLLKHPIQANLAAPFFTVVEIFHLLGLRKELFEEVRRAVEARRQQEATA